MEDELIEAAQKACKFSYSPYSNFSVGAAILTEDDQIFIGTNVENASLGLTICAERVAVFNALSHGCRKFKMLAVYTPTDIPVYPCGACLQVISEFCDNLPIIIAWKRGKLRTTLNTLLVHPFRGEA